MKNNVLLIFVATSLFFATCKKGGCNGDAIVVKDCTGTYLRMMEKAYQVCNPEKLSSFSDGQKVNAKHKKISECNGTAKDAAMCMMAHPSEGWIEVESVKKGK